jgi:hypothetical protein
VLACVVFDPAQCPYEVCTPYLLYSTIRSVCARKCRQNGDGFSRQQHSSRATCTLKLCMGVGESSYCGFDRGLACISCLLCASICRQLKVVQRRHSSVSAYAAPGILSSRLFLPRSFPLGMYNFILLFLLATCSRFRIKKFMKCMSILDLVCSSIISYMI